MPKSLFAISSALSPRGGNKADFSSSIKHIATESHKILLIGDKIYVINKEVVFDILHGNPILTARRVGVEFASASTRLAIARAGDGWRIAPRLEEVLG